MNQHAPDNAVEKSKHADPGKGTTNERFITCPKLGIVSESYDYGERFKVGTWVLASKTMEPLAIGKMDQPLRLVCLRYLTMWLEQVHYCEQRRPKCFDTLAEAQAAGYQPEDGRNPIVVDPRRIPHVAAAIRVAFWLPQPPGVDQPQVFNRNGPEGPGTLTVLCATKAAFETAGRPIVQASQSFLTPEMGGLIASWWELTAEELPVVKTDCYADEWMLPHLNRAEETSEDLRKFLWELQ